MKGLKDFLIYAASGSIGSLLNLYFDLLSLTGIRYLQKKTSRSVINLFGQEVVELRKDHDPFWNKQVNRAILALPSFGCTHYFEKGGCAMCGFNKEIEAYNFRALHPEAINFLSKTFLTWLEMSLAQRNYFITDIIAVFMGGSFLNEKELPIEAQKSVLNFFKKSTAKRLVIESRPEYILQNEKRLTKYISYCGKQIELAIGFEAKNDHIRNVLIKKNISRDVYERAVKIAKRSGAIVSTYILMGAPGYGEEEIIRETVETAEYAWSCGSDLVNIEPYCVQKNTPWEKAYEKKLIKPPNLWSIIEVLKRVDETLPKWYLGKFSDWPPPLAIPGSCPICQELLIAVLNDVREYHEMERVNQLPTCVCQN